MVPEYKRAVSGPVPEPDQHHADTDQAPFTFD